MVVVGTTSWTTGASANKRINTPQRGVDPGIRRGGFYHTHFIESHTHISKITPFNGQGTHCWVKFWQSDVTARLI